MNKILFFSIYNFGYQNAVLADFFVFAADKLPYIVIFVTLGYLVYKKVYIPRILVIYVTSVAAWIIAKILKLLVHSPRPFDAFPHVTSLIPESGYAFPSGHATFFMALAVAVMFYDKRAGYVLMGCAVVIGLARVIVGVHFPGDILGGLILGALVAYGAHTIIYALLDHFFPPHHGHH